VVPDGPAAGPVKDRLEMLLGAVIAAGAGVLLLLLFATAFNLYNGTRSGYFGPVERPAVARVASCERAGPVSPDGFGYWWRCHARVQVADGRMINTVVDRSTLTPADKGHAVEFREACKIDEGGRRSKCSYGRPVGRGWKVLVTTMSYLERVLIAFCAVCTLLCLVRAVLGRGGYARLYSRFSRA
ncbi:MAG TPA: DUF6346 domain-containing protein, partial [Streptosporangiaceae bacterium]